MVNPLMLINYVPYVNMHHDPWLFIQIEITPMNNVAFTDKNKKKYDHINNIFFS